MQQSKKIISAFLAFLFVFGQMNAAMALVLNCAQVNPDNLTPEQAALYNGGLLSPVSTYATQIKNRFDTEVPTIKDQYKKGKDGKTGDQCTKEGNNPNQCDADAVKWTAKCPEIDGWLPLDANGIPDSENRTGSLYNAYFTEFATKIETMFQNKSSNSSLVPTALLLFDTYSRKQDMLCGLFHYYLFDKTVTQDASATDLNTTNNLQTDVNTRYGECRTILTKTVDDANILMMNHIKSTAAQKQASLFSEKYKAVNAKMNDLNNSVARMYAFFQTFANKLLFKAQKQMIGF